MQWSLSTLHAFDWHTPVFVEVQPAWPFARPHLPFDPHAFVTHSLPFVQLVVTFGPPQVFVVALQPVLSQVALAFEVLQTPVWSPSFGIATPFALSAVHAPVLRLQCWFAAQSASTQQVPAAMHVPEFVEHVADWHSVDAVDAVQPASPSVRPHLPFVPHTFVMHWFAFVQLVVTFGPPHVFVAPLQRPLAQAAFTSPVAHASWSVSAGSGVPFVSFGRHVNTFRAQ
jgi:hypothetical protein